MNIFQDIKREFPAIQLPGWKRPAEQKICIHDPYPSMRHFPSRSLTYALHIPLNPLTHPVCPDTFIVSFLWGQDCAHILRCDWSSPMSAGLLHRVVGIRSHSHTKTYGWQLSLLVCRFCRPKASQLPPKRSCLVPCMFYHAQLFNSWVVDFFP